MAVHAERQGRGGVLPPGMRTILEGGCMDTAAPKGGLRVGSDSGGGGGGDDGGAPTEQELYAGADAMEIVRDAHVYFSKRRKWQSSTR